MGEVIPSWKGDDVFTGARVSQPTREMTYNKLSNRQDNTLNPLIKTAAIAGWTLWVAIAGVGTVWAWSEFRALNPEFQRCVDKLD